MSAELIDVPHGEVREGDTVTLARKWEDGVWREWTDTVLRDAGGELRTNSGWFLKRFTPDGNVLRFIRATRPKPELLLDGSTVEDGYVYAVGYDSGTGYTAERRDGQWWWRNGELALTQEAVTPLCRLPITVEQWRGAMA